MTDRVRHAAIFALQLAALAGFFLSIAAGFALVGAWLEECPTCEAREARR